MVAHQIHDTHNARSADHAHLRPHALQPPLVEGHIVVLLADAAIDHMGRDGMDALQKPCLHPFRETAVPGEPGQLAAQHLVVVLKHQILLHEFPVGLIHPYILQQFRLLLKQIACQGVGLREPYTSLVVVEVKKHPPTECFQYDEKHPVGICCKTIENCSQNTGICKLVSFFFFTSGRYSPECSSVPHLFPWPHCAGGPHPHGTGC